MENLKVKVNSIEESKEIQELFFELGFGWHGKGKKVSYSEKILGYGFGWLVLWKPDCLVNKVIQIGTGFENVKEITIEQLRDMVVLKRNDVSDATHENLMYPYVKLTDGWYYFDKGETNKWLKSTGGKQEYFDKLKPISEKQMKEWIYKDGSGEYVLTTDPEVANLAADAVEVPCGAEILCWFEGDKDSFFYKSNDHIFKDGEWSYVGHGCKFKDLISGNAGKLLWQREKPQEKCADICGDIGESDVQSTLEERESQYGSFSDVAELTCGLIGSLVRPDMSFVQREALHMICSKLARIHCGDINKIDSWHDIAGYATLVVKDLEKKAIDADKINLSDNRDWVEEIEKNS